MGKRKNDIEKLFSNGLKDLTIEPSGGSWKKVSRQLNREDFMHFRPKRFNIYYTGLIVLVLAGLSAFFYLRRHSENPAGQAEPGRESANISIDSHISPDSDTARILNENTFNKQNIPAVPDPETGKPGKKAAGGSEVPKEKADVAQVTVEKAMTEEHIEKPEVAQNRTAPLQTEAAPEIRAVNTNLPIAFFQPSVSEGCVPLTVRFSNLSVNDERCTWSFGDGSVTNEKQPFHRFDKAGTYLVTLTAEGRGNTVSAITRTIIVSPKPHAGFEVEDVGEPGSGGAVYFYNTSTGASEYLWDFGDGGGSAEKDPTWYYSSDSNFTITLIARDSAGCADTTVTENAFAHDQSDIRFPNAFTPDMNGPAGGYYRPGDSNHDVFHPYTDAIPEEYELKIYNRLGNLVFESHDIRLGWDGYYQGKLQPRGVYVWKVTGRFTNGKSFEKMGDITLIYQDVR